MIPGQEGAQQSLSAWFYLNSVPTVLEISEAFHYY